MGTTAEKGAYIIETKSLLKDKINNLGGSIDDNTTFRQYANQLQNVYDNLPKTSYQEGTEVNLGKTIKGKLDYDNGVVSIGQSSQYSTEGYNILQVPSAELSTTSGGIVMSNLNGIITLNGTATANVLVYVPCVIANGTSITIKLFNNKYQSATGNITCRLFTSKGTSASYNANVDSANLVKTTTVTGDINWFAIRIASGEVLSNFQFKPMVYTGTTDKDWEKYTGGQASPNPTYPQTINSVTGNQEEVVSGKNLFNGVWTNGKRLNATTGAEENNENACVSDYIPVDFNKNPNYYLSGLLNTMHSTVWAYNSSKQGLHRTANETRTSLGLTFSSFVGGTAQGTGDIAYIRINMRIEGTDTGSLSDLDNATIMLSTTSGDYEPYITPTSYQLSLGDIELNAIGDYKDYIWTDRSTGKWYKHSAIKKVTFNENTPNLTLQSINSHNIANFLISYLETNVLSATKVSSALSNLFSIQDTSIANTTEEGFLPSYSASQSMIAVYIRIKSTTASTTTEFRNWLQNHNISYYFALYNETDTEITDTTLINQLEAWYNAHSNNGTTIITSNGNLPMIIKVRGLKGE